MNIFITGATGFLGQQVLSALHARNHMLTALVRSPDKAGFPEKVRVVQGTVENTNSYKPHLKGHDIFVHIAALVKMWVPDPQTFDRVNVQAVEDAIRAAADAGIRRFIHTSSFIALGPSNGKPLSEEDERRTDHFHNHYERTKFLGDQIARKYQQDQYPVTILYPGVIYGSGSLTDGNIIAKNIIPLLNGKMPFGMSILTWSYAFIQDVVQAFVRIIEQDTPSNRYILGGDNRSGSEFYGALQEVSGRKPPSMNIPMPIAKFAGYSEYLLAEWFGREPSMLTHQVVEIYKHSWAYDSTRAKQELGYQITPLNRGLHDLVSWLRSAGHVKK
jgi:NAD+-dependent farnesol dehydrogenase